LLLLLLLLLRLLLLLLLLPQSYDVVVARAVADMRLLAELCLPFVRPGGTWVAAKGANPEVRGMHHDGGVLSVCSSTGSGPVGPVGI
jgi:hypothetical protein